MKVTSSNANKNQKPVILITGASSGIGLATVHEFSKKGWHVIATMRNPEAGSELAKLPGVDVQKLDVTLEDSINEVVTYAESKYGHVDVLLNNAGYGLMGVFEEIETSKIQKQFSTNVFGLMNVTRRVIPLMRRQKSGKIINISSIGGRIGIPLYSSYHATKFAVEGFSESLRYELAPFGIDVVLIEPGAIATDFYGRSSDSVPPKLNSPYSEYFKKVDKAYLDASTKGSKPEVVAARIYQVANGEKKGLRHPVGGGAELLMCLRRILPDCALRGMVKQQTKG